jgi:dCMP deaminase
MTTLFPGVTKSNTAPIRQSWDDYFMSIAIQAATRSTCPRKQVGCVIVKAKAIVATGYNGSLPAQAHCHTNGCFLQDSHCVRTIHAETNAINQAAKNGISLNGATIYCNVEPCWNCYKNILSVGIDSIFFQESYGSKLAIHQQCISHNLTKYKKVK